MIRQIIEEATQCTCHDGMVCDTCTAQQIEQAMRTPVNPTLMREEVRLLEISVEVYFNTLKGAQ